MDLQVLIPKVNEVSKVQQVQQQENNTRQQEFASQLNQQTVKAETSVNKSPRHEDALVREKEEHEKKQGNKEKREGKSQTKENTDIKVESNTVEIDDGRGHKVDLRA